MNAKDFSHFHLEPFELRWDRQDGSSERIFSELYTTDAFIKAHQEVQSTPPVLGCTRPRVVVALMLWSDATHLTSFGEAELHPIYLFFGNESKYRRDHPSAHLANHIAYLINVCPRFLPETIGSCSCLLDSCQTILKHLRGLRLLIIWLQAKRFSRTVRGRCFMLNGGSFWTMTLSTPGRMVRLTHFSSHIIY